jgi:hypothetical protein
VSGTSQDLVELFDLMVLIHGSPRDTIVDGPLYTSSIFIIKDKITLFFFRISYKLVSQSYLGELTKMS